MSNFEGDFISAGIGLDSAPEEWLRDALEAALPSIKLALTTIPEDLLFSYFGSLLLTVASQSSVEPKTMLKRLSEMTDAYARNYEGVQVILSGGSRA